MTRDEVKEIIMIMTYTYPNYKPADVRATVDTWTAILASYQSADIKAALHAYILSDTKGFAPSPGQLIDKVPSFSFEMSEMEAWSLVSKAVSNSIYNAKEEYEKLPVIVQKVLRTHEVLYEWALMEADTVQSVIQSNFMRNYRIILQREKDNSKLPLQLKQLLKSEIATLTIDEKTESNEDKT